MRIFRYLQTGVLLHLMGIFGIWMCVYFFELSVARFENKEWGLGLIYGYLCIHGFTLPFFSQFDARSRYINYKMLKDKLHVYGFDQRIIKPFAYSKCQRDAIRVAAKDFELEKSFDKFIFQMGFRWYHILPHFVVRKPSILFTKSYWEKTLFVKNYQSKYFLW